MDWFYINDISSHELAFVSEASWYSEALLPSQFLARFRGDKLAESWTNADGVIGHFRIGNQGKEDILLDNKALQFKVLEAKIYSKLSAGVSNASYYNQAARNVACMAEVVSRKKIEINNMDIGFDVLAPENQINKKLSFRIYTSKKHIEDIVLRRIKEYDNKDKNNWYENWFLPLIKCMEIKCLSWEDIINFIKNNDKSLGKELDKFYNKCLRYSK